MNRSMKIESGQRWKMTAEAAELLPSPPAGWPREVTIIGAYSRLGAARVSVGEDGETMQVPFCVLERYYRRTKGGDR